MRFQVILATSGKIEFRPKFRPQVTTGFPHVSPLDLHFRTSNPLHGPQKCSHAEKNIQTHPLSTLPDLLVRFQAILGTSGKIDFRPKFHFFFELDFSPRPGRLFARNWTFFNLARAQIFDTDFFSTSRLRRSTQNSVGFHLRPFSGRVVVLNPYTGKVL